MTTTRNEMTLGQMSPKKTPDPSAEELAAVELVQLAREAGLSLTGPQGLLKQFTKTVLADRVERVGVPPLAGEMTEHLGHQKNRATAERETSNVRNGTRPKTVLTEASGQVQIEVPRDREGTFTPVIPKKRQRRLSGVDEIVLSLYANGLTTGGDQRPLPVDLWCVGIQGDGLADHRPTSATAGSRTCSSLSATVLRACPRWSGNVWPRTTVQTCIIHLIRNTFRLASKKDWDALKRDVKPIYTAPSPAAARAAFEEMAERWGPRYGAIVRLWENAWEEFIPFLDYDVWANLHGGEQAREAKRGSCGRLGSVQLTGRKMLCVGCGYGQAWLWPFYR